VRNNSLHLLLLPDFLLLFNLRINGLSAFSIVQLLQPLELVVQGLTENGKLIFIVVSQNGILSGEGPDNFVLVFLLVSLKRNTRVPEMLFVTCIKFFRPLGAENFKVFVFEFFKPLAICFFFLLSQILGYLHLSFQLCSLSFELKISFLNTFKLLLHNVHSVLGRGIFLDFVSCLQFKGFFLLQRLANSVLAISVVIFLYFCLILSLPF
jgi:hypothetical protein